MTNIVIIGGGIATVSAVKAIREINPEVTIDLFCEERFYPYYRLKLSKSLFDELDADDILLQKKDWYEKNQINLHLNVRVQGIDVGRQEIILPQEKRIRYGKLLLANGAVNRPPAILGMNDGKMNTIRNLEDVQRLHRALEGKKKILYIGGGVLGLETAWILLQHQKQVSIAEIQNRLFPNQLDERAATILKNLVESCGIRVFTGADIVNITGGQAVDGVEMKDGSSFPCEMVLYSTGINPNIDILKGTPLLTHRGVVVNEKMETNIANIYASGDVAEFDGRVYGQWNVAMGQGKTAGYNMANQEALYQPPVPVTMLNAYGISLFSMGDVSETGATRTIIEEERSKKSYWRIFINNQVIVGAIMIGDTGKSLLLKTAIERKLPLDGINWRDSTIAEILGRLKTLE